MDGVIPRKSIIVSQPLVREIPNDVRMDDDQLIYGIQISLLTKRIDGQNHFDDDITSLRNLHARLDSEDKG